MGLACQTTPTAPARPPGEKRVGTLSFAGEKRIKNLRQLTFGGTNAEAYWSYDSRWLVFQRSGPEAECDQIFKMKADGSSRVQLSSGKGRTTCGFFTPNDRRILYSTTSPIEDKCPAPPDKSHGYVWGIFPSYRIYTSATDGSEVQPAETTTSKGYTAEATTCSDGSVVFTSDRDGDLELYVGKMDKNGQLKNIKRVTRQVGYDGGANFSADCTQLVWRASRPVTQTESDEYFTLLRKHLVKPGKLEIWTAKADGSDARQVTHLDAASFAPVFTPDGKHILFSSNYKGGAGTRNFDIFMIRPDGTHLEQLTYAGGFDSFPMISPDGDKIVFASSRFAKERSEINIFVGDWDGSHEDAAPLSPEDANASNRFMAVVEKLSSPDMQGRGVTTDGIKKAESFVEEEFRRIGLRPFFELFQPGPAAHVSGKLTGYRQPVEIQTGVSADLKQTEFQAEGTHYKVVDQFYPAEFSTNGEFNGVIRDSGFGIVAPELGLDDYDSFRATGRVALIRRYTPKSLKLTVEQERSYSDLRYKAYVARERGASAVIFWDSDEESSDRFKNSTTTRTLGGTSDVGIPVLFVSRGVGKELVALAKGGQPVEVHGKVLLKKDSRTTHNLLGVLGDHCSEKPVVVIGAHLDHLGMGSSHSLESSKTGLHPGADDNASGIAGILEAARVLKGPKRKTATAPEACYIFAAFTGEEVGVVGSSHLVNLLQQMKFRPKAMLNLDMVGRLRNNFVLSFGTDTATQWASLLKEECQARGLTCAGGGDGYGPSDHMPFYIAGVPVLHFFTGAHSEYHRPSDVASLVNATGGVQIADVVAAVAKRVGASHQRLDFQRPKSATTLASAMGSGDVRSFGAYLGTIPDYSMMQPNGETLDPGSANPTKKPDFRGVKLAGTRPGSPAELAGVRPGDILVGILQEGQKRKHILSLEDFTYVLKSLRPGQKVDLAVQREGTEILLTTVVGRREK